VERGNQVALERVLLVLPGAAAIGLGLLYAVGALFKAAEFRGEHLPIPSALQLLSLESILARGISAVIAGAAAALFTVVVFGLLYRASQYLEERLSRHPLDLPADHSQLQVKVRRWVLIPVTVVLYIASLGFLAIPLAVALGLSLTGLLNAGPFGPRRYPWITLPRVILAQMLLAVVAMVANAWFYPQPLPRAVLAVEPHRLVEGHLITNAADQWFLARGPKIIGIPLKRVAEIRVEGEPFRPRPTVLSQLQDLVGL